MVSQLYHQDTSWCRTTDSRQTLHRNEKARSDLERSGSKKPHKVTACRICKGFLWKMLFHVYAYGRKTVRAFCFFFEYCSLSWGWGGVGWGGMLTFLVLRTWYIAMLLLGLGWGGVGGHGNVPCTSYRIYCDVAKISGIFYYVTCCYAAGISEIVSYVTCCYAAEISGIVYYVTGCYAAEILGIAYYVTCCYAAEISGIVYYVTCCYAAEISGIVYYVTCCYAAEISGIVYYVTCCYAAEISGIVYYVTCCYAAEISGIVYYVTCCYAAGSGVMSAIMATCCRRQLPHWWIAEPTKSVKKNLRIHVWCTWCLPGFVKNQ